MSQADNTHINTRMLERTVFFSDAVFAIVLTLLVLELRPPVAESEAELAAGLNALGVHFITFVISFALGAAVWMAHMRTMRSLRVFDWPTAIANLFHLFAVAVIPFGSALLGEHIGSPLAFQVYSVMMIAISATSCTLWLVASRGGGRLMGGIPLRVRLAVTLRASAIGLCFVAALVLSLIGQINLARFCWAFMFPLNFIAHWIGGPTVGEGVDVQKEA